MSIAIMPTFFRVGPWRYDVRIVRDLRDESGTPVMGRCDYDTHTICVNADVKWGSRLNVVLHELVHAWRHHFPRPRTEEETADFGAAIIAAAFEDLSRMGGPGVLSQLQPEDDDATRERRRAGGLF